MVSFRAIGRMGNFLFEAASSYGYARRHDLEWSVPNWSTHNFHSPIYLQHLVNPNYNKREDVLINEHGMEYNPIIFKEEWRHLNIVLNGYWQSEKYFKEYREDILNLWNYPYKFMKGWVSVHVRRGDYLILTQKHPPISIQWYEEAMNMFAGYNFIFFSDDIGWCKNVFGTWPKTTFSETNSIEQDLIEASWCEHNIISASTFGWWQAWLNQNPNKKVILPKLWFQPGWDGLDTSDVVPEQWIKL